MMNILINEFGLFCPIGRESWPRSATYCCIDSSGLISFHSSEPKYSAIFGGWQGVPIEERTKVASDIFGVNILTKIYKTIIMFKETFIKCLGLQKEFSSNVDSSGMFGSTLIECADPLQKVISTLFSELLTEEGIDWLDWFLWEKGYAYGKDQEPDANQAYDEEGNEILKDVDELYAFFVEHDYFKYVFK